MNSPIHCIGLMSGTSLDGLDICYVRFDSEQDFEIISALTIEYPEKWKYKLKSAYHWKSEDLLALDVEYGYFLGREVARFIALHSIEKLNFVASHGHTIFHQPNRNFTLQIGHGAAIRSKLNVPIVCDFRTQDVVLGGQGAPLVPIGDELLFERYDACLNLGGFSNISMNRGGKRIAFDICPVNLILNHLANQLGYAFDCDGKIASKGVLNKELFDRLNELEYYQLDQPKSLGYESVEQLYLPLIESYKIPVEDQLHTYTQHIVYQIHKTTKQYTIDNILVTGGGAKNTFLMQLFSEFFSTKIIIPDNQLIDYKEALIFAFLGWRRLQNKTNCLASVTGAKFDHSSGIIYL